MDLKIATQCALVEQCEKYGLEASYNYGLSQEYKDMTTRDAYEEAAKLDRMIKAKSLYDERLSAMQAADKCSTSSTSFQHALYMAYERALDAFNDACE